MASPGLSRRPVWIIALGAALLVGALPPVLGRPGSPSTVIRTVGVAVSPLIPRTARIVPEGADGYRFTRTTSTRPRTICSPIPFQTAGFTWEGNAAGARGLDRVPVRADVFWGPGYARRVTTTADSDDGPDVGSPEQSPLIATDPVWLGETRCLRLRLHVPAGEVIRDLQAVFINTSGTADGPVAAATSALSRVWGVLARPLGQPAQAMTSQPTIISRVEWGADEGMRNCGPDYADAVKMAFVHHTAGSNNYRRHQSDDVVRGIYAYHTETRGWCDIGYNFLVDRFGRVFEGRHGGIEQPVIGAHALGFNTGSTGISVMGNFETAKPGSPSIDALTSLLAWRLDVAHVPPAGWTTMVSGGGSGQQFDEGQSVRLRAISGHRDTGNTACPGRWLYARLGSIRSEAKNLGLPKIWKPTQTPSQIETGGEEVRWRATLSGSLEWTIEVTNESGLRIERFTGTGDVIKQTWDTSRQGVPIAPGTYTVTMSATGVLGSAREAIFTLSVGPFPGPSPSPSPTPSPTPSS